MHPLVSYQRTSDSISVLTMDDGKRNALSPAMLTELGAALDQAEADGTVVVLTGRPGVFSAGFDLRVMQAGGPDAADMVRDGFLLSVRLLDFPAPVVVACTGHALAMASFLLLSADYRLGARGEFKIGANEVAIGMAMPQPMIELSRERLAPTHLGRSLLNAEIYRPDDAVTAGFLDRAVAADELAEQAQGTAAALAALSRSAHVASKRSVRAELLTAMRASVAEGAAQMRKVLADRAAASPA